MKYVLNVINTRVEKKLLKVREKRITSTERKQERKTPFVHTQGEKTQESNNNCTVTVTMQWHTKRVRSISECGGCKTTLV